MTCTLVVEIIAIPLVVEKAENAEITFALFPFFAA